MTFQSASRSATKEIAAFIVEDENVEYDEALRKLYTSNIFEKIIDKETYLYREGAAYVYQYYLEEQAYLADNAEILHTQGKNYILDSIDGYMKNHP